MATESLIIELDAHTAKVDKKLKATDKNLNKLDDTTQKAESSFLKMGKTAVVAAAAIAASVSALAISSAAFARELEVASRRAGESVERMQALAFASKTVGISLEKLGDISKDTNEKIGEFLSTGGGGFVDFVDVMRLGKQAARDLAAQFETMSGPAVLQEMVRQMEAAGISTNQMSFALEGVASDATDLIPLLRNNGAELNNLTDEFQQLGAALTQEQLDKIKQVGIEFDKIGATFSADGQKLIAEYSDEIITLIEWFRTLGTVFIDATDVIAAGWGNIVELSKAGLNDLVNGTNTFAETLEERTKITTEKIAKLLGETTGATEIYIDGYGKLIKKGTKLDELSYDQKLTNLQGYVKASQILNSAFFGDNKAIAAGLIVADTATAIMKSLSIAPYDYGNVAILAATGLAQLANALSASPGGGSTSSASGGSSTPQRPQENFEPATSSLDFNDATTGGNGQQTIRFAVDSGDDLVDAIAAALNKAQKQGRG